MATPNDTPLSPEEKEKLIAQIERKIDRFSDLMKSKLRSNIHKGDWTDTPPAGVVFRLMSQLGDLTSDMLGEGVGGDMGRLQRCVNIANFAFILADNLVGHLFEDVTSEDDD